MSPDSQAITLTSMEAGTTRHLEVATQERPGDARDLVALASVVLAGAGQSDLVWGHVSVRDPHGGGVWMKAAGWGLDEVTPDRVVLVSPEGEVLAGEGRRHIEYPIHTAVMAAREDVACVVHTHAPAPNAFASLCRPLRPLSHEGTLFVPPDIVRFTRTAGLIRSPEMGDALARDLGGRNAALIPGHGVVTVGAGVAAAVMTAVLLDRACRVQLEAEAAGGPRSWTSDPEALDKRVECWSEDQLRAGWDYLVRQAERRVR